MLLRSVLSTTALAVLALADFANETELCENLDELQRCFDLLAEFTASTVPKSCGRGKLSVWGCLVNGDPNWVPPQPVDSKAEHPLRIVPSTYTQRARSAGSPTAAMKSSQKSMHEGSRAQSQYRKTTLTPYQDDKDYQAPH